jgi:hypothetical protein
MALSMLRRVFQRSFSQTSFQHAIQRQIIQEDGKIIMKKKRSFYSIKEFDRCNIIEKRK